MNLARDIQQTQHLLAESSRILVVPGNEYPLDTLPASLGLAHTLSRLGKRVYISYHDQIPELLRFLPLDKFLENNATFDCVVAIGVQRFDLSQYASHPLIIISTSEESGSEHSTTTIIDKHASSCAELVTRFLKVAWEDYLEEDAATSLLTGIIAHTENFQRTHVQPQTLFAAAYLIAKNAKRESVIQSLYKERPLKLIRLLGRVLANVHHDTQRKVVWSSLTQNDFSETETSPSIIPSLLREFVVSIPKTLFIILIWEIENKDGAYEAVIRSRDEESIMPIFNIIGGTRRKNNILLTLSADTREGAINTILGALPQEGEMRYDK